MHLLLFYFLFLLCLMRDRFLKLGYCKGKAVNAFVCPPGVELQRTTSSSEFVPMFDSGCCSVFLLLLFIKLCSSSTKESDYSVQGVAPLKVMLLLFTVTPPGPRSLSPQTSLLWAFSETSSPNLAWPAGFELEVTPSAELLIYQDWMSTRETSYFIQSQGILGIGVFLPLYFIYYLRVIKVEISLICWFTPQMPVTVGARTGPEGSQEPGTQSSSPRQVGGTKPIELLSAVSPGVHQQEAGWEAEPKCKPRTSSMGYGCPSGSLTALSNACPWSLFCQNCIHGTWHIVDFQ